MHPSASRCNLRIFWTRLQLGVVAPVSRQKDQYLTTGFRGKEASSPRVGHREKSRLAREEDEGNAITCLIKYSRPFPHDVKYDSRFLHLSRSEEEPFIYRPMGRD